MARSIARPSLSGTRTLFFSIPDDMNAFDWDELKEAITDVVRSSYKEFREPVGSDPHFLGHENRVLLLNGLVLLSVSSYGLLVGVHLSPDPDNFHLGDHWIDQVWDKMTALIESCFEPGTRLQSFGRASNGEEFFRPVSRPSAVISSKEGEIL